MAAGIVSNSGLIKSLKLMLQEQITVRLYQNDVLPGPTNVIADFTPASFPGYSDVVISGSMTTPIAQGPQQALTSSEIISWVRGVGGLPQTIYGYIVIVTDFSGNTYFGGERFGVPRTLSNPGDSITLQTAIIATSAV